MFFSFCFVKVMEFFFYCLQVNLSMNMIGPFLCNLKLKEYTI